MSAKIPAKPSKDTIYIDVDDEITGIIDKIENSENKVVALVLPKRAASLQSIVNMKLLKRSADTAGKNVVLITSEAALLPLAGAAGLHVAKNLQSVPEVPDSPRHAAPAADKVSAEEVPEETEDADEEDLPKKFDYGKPVGALAAAHEAENPETIDLDDDEGEAASAVAAKASKIPKGAKVKVPNFDRFRLMLGLGVLAFVALIVFLILAIAVLPKAKITIQTSSEPVSANFTLNVAAGVALDPAKGTIPAKLETMDQTGSQSVTATGSQNNGQKTVATITLSIPCSDVTSYPEEVPIGTGITSSNGLTYLTQKTVDLTQPGGGGGCSFTGSVNIAAQAGGSKYDAPISPFSVAHYPNVSGSTFQIVSHGTDNTITVLSQSDVDNATQKLTTGATADAFAKSFENKLAGQNEYVFVSTLKTAAPVITASPAVGQPASTSSVTIKITYTVLAVQKSDLSTAIQAKLASQIDKTKQKLNGNFLNDANITIQSQPAPNSAVLAINENTTAVPIIDIASVKKQAKGKKVGDIKSAIGNWAGVKSVDIKLSPFWVSKAPGKDSKITVVLQEVKNSSNSSAP